MFSGGCRAENSSIWVTLNFGGFSPFATLREMYQLSQDFNAVSSHIPTDKNICCISACFILFLWLCSLFNVFDNWTSVCLLNEVFPLCFSDRRTGGSLPQTDSWTDSWGFCRSPREKCHHKHGFWSHLDFSWRSWSSSDAWISHHASWPGKSIEQMAAHTKDFFYLIVTHLGFISDGFGVLVIPADVSKTFYITLFLNCFSRGPVSRDLSFFSAFRGCRNLCFLHTWCNPSRTTWVSWNRWHLLVQIHAYKQNKLKLRWTN